jgi:hypothetical protein
LRAAASNEEASSKVRSIFAAQVLPMLAAVIERGELARRGGLVASQLLGFALCRYVLKVPPVMAMSAEEIVRAIGPTLQRYINGNLD